MTEKRSGPNPTPDAEIRAKSAEQDGRNSPPPPALDPAVQPVVTIQRSECGALRCGDPMAFFDANRLFEKLDAAARQAGRLERIRFSISYLMRGRLSVYRGGQTLGSGEGSLIGHIRAHQKRCSQYDQWTVQVQGQTPERLADLISYLQAHRGLAELEQSAAAAQDAGPAEAAYGAAVRSYVDACRGQLNTAPGGFRLPAPPKREEFPGVEPPQGPSYDVMAFTDRQWTEITAGWKSGVDTAKYSNPAFDAMQMNRIRVGLEKGLPASLYNKPNLSWEQMDIVMKLMEQGHDVTGLYVGGRPVDFTDPALPLSDMKGLLLQMEYDAIPKMLYTPEQWAEIRRGMEAGLNVKQYTDPKLAPEDMAKLRDALERGLIIHTAPEAEAPTEGQANAPAPALDEYPMPDPALTVDDLEKCGYRDGDMLPLSKVRALELFEQDLAIYTMAEGGEASMAFDREDIETHGGLLAVPREEWEAAADFAAAVEDRLNRQEQREAAFLQAPRDAFAVYQLKEGGALQGLRELSLSELENQGRKVEHENYDLVYTGAFPRYNGMRDRLEGIYSNGLPADCPRPGLATGDIIAIKQGGVVSCHYCDSLDFVELPGFLPADNPLKSEEMAVEGGYGMIDGVISNGPKQPTAAALDAQVKAGRQASLPDLARASHREREKQSVMERLKQQPPQRDKKKEAPKKSAEREL